MAGTTSDFGNLSVLAENWEDSNGLLFDDELAGSSFSVFLDGEDIYLNFTAAAIPEPSTFLLSGIGALGLILRRRRN